LNDDDTTKDFIYRRQWKKVLEFFSVAKIRNLDLAAMRQAPMVPTFMDEVQQTPSES
jgi:hypothetical protein